MGQLDIQGGGDSQNGREWKTDREDQIVFVIDRQKLDVGATLRSDSQFEPALAHEGRSSAACVIVYEVVGQPEDFAGSG